MINFKIHYTAPGYSPQARLASAETNMLAYIANEVAKPKPYIIFEKLLKKVANTLNKLLQDSNAADGKPLIANDSDCFSSLEELLATIIPELEQIEEQMANNKVRIANLEERRINKKLIEELTQLQNARDIGPIAIIEILVQFRVTGIQKIEFTTGINQEILSDIKYPMSSIPDAYNCTVLTTIMSDPIVATPTARIDRLVTAGARTNPFTRAPWLAITRDDDLFQEINLLVRKAEWLYYAFQADQKFLDLYLDPVVQDLLQDRALSYVDFKTRVKQHLKGSIISCASSEEAVYPCKYLLDLFWKFDIHVQHPKTQDYEQLIRTLAYFGDVAGLEQLLKSPVLEFININVYAKSNNGQNVFDILNSPHCKRPDLKDACYQLLTRYQEPSDNANPSRCRWICEQANSYLPAFNRYTVLATLSTLVTIGTSIYFNSNSSEAPRATPNL